MKATKFVLLIGLLCAALSAGYLAEQTQKNKAEVALQAAIKTETVDGDLRSAIEQYKKIAEMPDADRTTVATALLRMGQCHEKMGETHTQEALKAYEQVVSEYGDQAEIAKAAREKLSLLERAKAIVEKEDQGIKMTEIPIDPEKNYYSFAFISPDEKKLAYVDINGDIWINDIASGKEFQLTQTPAWEYWCSWSPDSQKICYLDYNANLYVASAQEGNPITQIEIKPGFDREGWFSSWSPDSQRLNVWFSKQGLYAIPISGGEWKEIFKYSNPEQVKTFSQLLLSPNEKFILYNDTTGNKDIYNIPVDGGEPAQITNHPAHDAVELWFGQPWSYDGRWVVFFSERNGNYEPWIIGISPDGKRQGEPFQIPFLSTANAASLLFNWTKEGQIGLSVGQRISNLFVSNLDGDEEIQLTHVECLEQKPIWSPDNRYIAYISSDNGTNREVWIVPVLGGEPQKISGHLSTRPGVEIIYSIAWHPNGRNVSCVVTSGDDSGPWTIDIQSGVARKIPFGYDGDMKGMDWSPDGKRIAFYYSSPGTQNAIKESEVKKSNIYTISAEGGESVRLTRFNQEDGLEFGFPRWSPDGKKIVFADSEWRIWIVGSEGGEPQLITDKISPLVAEIRELYWSPDGETIYFSGLEKEKEKPKSIFCSVSSQDGEPRILNKSEGYDLDLSPDGNRIVYRKELKPINKFWLLENFLPERK